MVPTFLCLFFLPVIVYKAPGGEARRLDGGGGGGGEGRGRAGHCVI